MDIRYLESLIAVAEQGSIVRAARTQRISAAAVGQRISLLEEHFGVALLDRSSGRAMPTEACVRLLPHARKLVADFHELGALFEPMGLSGRFALGVIPSALTGVLPKAVRRLARLAPNLALEIKPGTSEAVYRNLCEKTIHAGILALPAFALPDAFSVEIIRKEPLVLLSQKDAGKTRRERLENNPYICFDPKSWADVGASKFLKDEGIHIEPAYELDTLEPIAKLVQEGMGVSLIPYWSGLDMDTADLKFDIIRNEQYCRKIALVTPHDSTRPQAVKTLRAALLSDSTR
jgi:DNA-binding transcriptional LysR family regulator